MAVCRFMKCFLSKGMSIRHFDILSRSRIFTKMLHEKIISTMTEDLNFLKKLKSHQWHEQMMFNLQI